MLYDVSIIIPVYNNERSISRCLDSIVSQQTKFSFEVILVSDPCTDKTMEIIDTYIKKYPFIKNINVSSRVIGVARNVGINASNGKYLMFIDADDYYSMDAIELMITTLESTNSDIVSASNYYVRGSKISKNFFRKNKTYNRKGMLKALMQDSYMHGFMWNKIYKAELLKNKNYALPKKNIIREDVLTNFQVFLNANKLTMISKPMYFYDKTYESTTSSKDFTRVPWFIDIFAIERYLIEKHEPTFQKMFLSLKNRRKLLIFGDKLIVKKGYSKEEYKKLKIYCKKYLKIINKKGTLELTNMPWESFIKDYLD